MISQRHDFDQAPNGYPVDSDYFPCCRGIGGHARQCVGAAADRIEQIRAELAEQLRFWPESAPLFSAVDLVTAIGHLRQACRRIERATNAILTAEAEV